MPPAHPFHASRYELRSGGVTGAPVHLRPLSAEIATDMSRALARIDPWARYPYPPDALATYFASGEPHAPRFGVEVGDTVAGVVGLRLELLRGPYLQFLGILPAYQRLGLGSMILDWMEREAGEAARNLWVCAADFNGGALRFYERHGFKRVATLDGLVQDGRDEILLRKRLK